jgi:hypothetical protein
MRRQGPRRRIFICEEQTPVRRHPFLGCAPLTTVLSPAVGQLALAVAEACSAVSTQADERLGPRSTRRAACAHQLRQDGFDAVVPDRLGMCGERRQLDSIIQVARWTGARLEHQRTHRVMPQVG